MTPMLFIALALLRQPIPGVINHSITQANIHQTICVPGYTSAARKVSSATKAAVYKRDHMRPSKSCCEIDHFFPLEIGGTNDLNNLWAQPWAEARRKDVLENKLHRQLCAGVISLEEAQRKIRSWGEK